MMLLIKLCNSYKYYKSIKRNNISKLCRFTIVESLFPYVIVIQCNTLRKAHNLLSTFTSIAKIDISN